MDERTRAWSVVALLLLSAILVYVLVRTPPSVKRPPPPHAPPRPQVQAGPVRPKGPGPAEEHPDAYQGWPLFFGWPLPEEPSREWGTGGSEGPILPAPAPLQPMVPLPGEGQ